jgi:hypothetical protein
MLICCYEFVFEKFSYKLSVMAYNDNSSTGGWGGAEAEGSRVWCHPGLPSETLTQKATATRRKLAIV